MSLTLDKATPDQAEVTASPSDWRTPLLLTLLALAAFLLRIHNLDFESLDIDEADVIIFAQADLSTLLQRLTQPGENGAAYILLVRAWTAVAGQSEFSLRYLSLIPSVLSVPLIYMLGKRLHGAGTGAAAALLLSGSTYLLYFAQMNKMYSLLLFLGLLSSYLLLRALARPRWWLWLAYVVATTSALAIHIFGVLLIPWQALFGVVYLWRSTPWRERAVWLPALFSLGALTLPYLPLAIQRLDGLRHPELLSREFTGPRDPLGMLAILARDYGTRYDLLPTKAIAAGFLLLALLGLATVLWQRHRHPPQPFLLFAGLSLGVPVLLVYGAVTLGAPLFSSRYLILTLPAFYLLWGAAIAGLWRWRKPAAVILALAFLIINGARWQQTAIGGQRYREDFRDAVQYLEQQYAPGDLAVVVHDSSLNALRYYATRPLRLASMEAGPGEAPNPNLLAASLPASGRLWLVATYIDAPGLTPIESWIERRAALITKRWNTGVMVSEYQLRRE